VTSTTPASPPQAVVTAVEDTENNRRVVFEVPDAKWMKYILPKVRAAPSAFGPPPSRGRRIERSEGVSQRATSVVGYIRLSRLRQEAAAASGAAR